MHPGDLSEAIDMATSIVDETGPVAIDDLVADLADRGYDFDREELVDELVARDYWFLGDHLLRAAHVLPGKTITHRITAEEIESGRLTWEPDFSLLILDDNECHVTNVGDFVEDFDRSQPARSWVAPKEWLASLRPGDVVGFCWTRPGALEVGAVEVTDGEREVAALVAAFEGNAQRTATVLDLAVVVAMRPDTFNGAPPLGELLDRAGFTVNGDEVAPEGFDWDALAQERHVDYVDFLAERYDLDRETAEHLSALSIGSLREPADHDASSLAAAAEALEDPDATYEFLRYQPSDEDEAARFRVFVDAVEKAAGRPIAGVHLVRARCAEVDGDAVTHAAEVERALTIDDDFWAALEDRAWVLSDRGDARRAFAVLEEEVDADDRRLDMLAIFSEPGPIVAGRNDSCPCGSGRKHKVCCGPHNGYPLAERALWLHEKAMWFARRTSQRRHVAALVRDAIDDYEPDFDAVNVFSTDETVVTVALFVHGLIERFAEQRSVILPADEAALLREWTGASMRLLRVDGSSQHALSMTDVVSEEQIVIPVGGDATVINVGRTIMTPLLFDGDQPSLVTWIEIADVVVEPARAAIADGDAVALVAAFLEPRWAAAKEAMARLVAEGGERLQWLFGVPPDDAGARFSIEELIERDHRELVDAIDEGLEEVEIEGGHLINPRLHLAIHEIVANQIIHDEPPEVWQTALRLTELGHDRHEVLHMLGSAMSEQLYDMINHGEHYDRQAHIDGLAKLPEAWHRRLHHHPRQHGRDPHHRH